MTVSNISPYNNYIGNGSTTIFDYDFDIDTENEIAVFFTNENGVQTKLVLNTDYSVNVDSDGVFTKKITFPIENSAYSVLQSDEVLSIALDLDLEQDKEYRNSSKLNLSMLEYSLDYLTRIAQIQNRQLERAVKIQEGSSSTPDNLIASIYLAQNNAQASATSASNSATIATEAASDVLRQTQADFNQTDNTKADFIKNKPDLASVATSGSYDDLSNKPSIPDISGKQDIGDYCITPATTTSTATLNKPAVVVENYRNGASWYRVYSDGWVEQGGMVTTNAFPYVVTLLKGYGTTNFSPFVSTNFYNSGDTRYFIDCGVATTNSINIGTRGANGGFSPSTIYWEAKGYGA